MISKTSAIFFTVAALAGHALAGDAIIVNQCSYPIYGYSIDVAQSQQPAQFEIAAGATYREPTRIVTDPATGGNAGVSIKISTESKNAPTPPITQLEYTVDPSQNTVSYDISFVDCATSPTTGAQNCPVWKDGLAVVCDSGKDGCPQFRCPAGQDCPGQIYYDPNATGAPGQVQPVGVVSPQGESVRFTLCSGGAAKRSSRIFKA